MIPFFRKTRKQMADDNPPVGRAGIPMKYMRYAIGEILLVVIGILIALSINKWNEERKNIVIEKEILTNIKNGFESDIKNAIESNIKACEKRISTTGEIIKASNMVQGIMDTIEGIEYLSTQTNFRIVSFPLKILESKGLDIIRDKDLKYAIINIHSEDYNYIKTVYENEMFNQRDIYRPMMNHYFKKVINGDEYEIQIIDSSSMLKDQSFMNAIITMNLNNIYLKYLLEELRIKVTTVVQQIETELGT